MRYLDNVRKVWVWVKFSFPSKISLVFLSTKLNPSKLCQGFYSTWCQLKIELGHSKVSRSLRFNVTAPVSRKDCISPSLIVSIKKSVLYCWFSASQFFCIGDCGHFPDVNEEAIKKARSFFEKEYSIIITVSCSQCLDLLLL